ncbi:hypothetical protein HQQ82_16605 [Rathayibacter sp. VKM Ac-2856]|uniref:hypothetical protein n=1 Tax=unclassified Rathayibacter TaxID=2609250 RepID=UPI00156636D2|nr:MULTISPECIES: hypothetical protein [unclassified Rathayibacter]NQX06431.1 hypothetical protein [Rathayibacter sp. VKM Ac-2858]NQX21598.1 hypothetical protein [Rathayibacter sp. VKM Ac-2856]
MRVHGDETLTGGLLRAPELSRASIAVAALFLVWSPAALEAGWWLLLGLGLAAVMAVVGAVADSGREIHDGPTAEWLALAGRALAASAVALTAADSIVGASARPVAVLLIVGATLFVLRGGALPPGLARILLGVVLLLLLASAVIVALAAPAAIPSETVVGGPEGVGTAAALLLVLFAPASPGETPTLGRSLLGIGVTTAVAALVGVGLLLLVGPQELADAPASLSAVAAGTPAVVLIGIAAVLASLLALVALSRRDAAALVRLADDGEIPGPFAHRNRRTGVPAAGQLAVCLVSVLAVVVLDADALLAFAVGASLVALILRRLDRGIAGARWPAIVSAAGALVLLLALPSATAAAVAILLALLLIVRAFRR